MLAPDSFKIVCSWKKIGQRHLDAIQKFFHDDADVMSPDESGTVTAEEEHEEEHEEEDENENEVEEVTPKKVKVKKALFALPDDVVD
jgi:hypothetical protein